MTRKIALPAPTSADIKRTREVQDSLPKGDMQRLIDAFNPDKPGSTFTFPPAPAPRKR